MYVFSKEPFRAKVAGGERDSVQLISENDK